MLIGAAVILEIVLGVLRISKSGRSSSRVSAFIATHIIINKSLKGKGGL